MTSVYSRTDSGGGREESQDNPMGCGECFFFLGCKSRGAFGQPEFFLGGNRMTIVAFEKLKVALKSLAKRLFDSTEVLNLRKTCNICKWKEKLQKNIGGGRKVQVTKAALKGLHLLVCFFTTKSLPCSETQPSIK